VGGAGRGELDKQALNRLKNQLLQVLIPDMPALQPEETEAPDITNPTQQQY
jgi:hypothetical protein